MLRLFLAISVLAMSCFSKTCFELCAHEAGEVHVYLLGNICEGQFAKSQSRGHHHDYESTSNHGHQHGSSTGDKEVEEHAPCEHEFLSFEGEWLMRVTQALSLDLPQADSLPFLAELPTLSGPQWTKIAAKFPPRAPPWPDGPKNHFLATIRLLV
ncbi:MAG: hypothetical protein ACNA77_02035 [Opitutales bacterium]